MTSLTMDLQDTVQDYNPYHESSDADMPQEASEQAMNGSKENDEVDKVNLANLLTDAPLKKKKKKKSKSQRGIVGVLLPFCFRAFYLSNCDYIEQAYRLRALLRRRPFDTRPSRRRS